MTISADSPLSPAVSRRAAPSVPSTPAAWFIALCMAVIACSLGVVLYTRAGFTVGEAGWASFAALVTMVLAEFYTLRQRERAQFERELRQIAQGTGNLSREVGQLAAKFEEQETQVSRRVRETVDARLGVLLDDMTSIEGLIRELSDQVKELKEAQDRPAPPPPPAPRHELGPRYAEPSRATPAPPPAADPALGKSIVYALLNEQVDVNLQAIVALPQRRAVHYEALARLRGQSGETLLPSQFLGEARRANLLTSLDAAVVQKCLRISEQVTRREPDAAIFCNIDAGNLRGSAAVSLLEIVEKAPEQARSLVFELEAEAFASVGSVERETMEALAELGCRFSLDNLTGLAFDGPRLARQQVRFLKVDAAVLLDPHVEVGDIHPTDFARLMARSGIDVVATRVETEGQVLNLLDFDISLGQGHLFGRPRPVRLGGSAPIIAAR